MNAELVLLGKHVSMAQRSRRRLLVATVYGALAALIIALWFANHWHGTEVYAPFAAIFACRLFFGGYYPGGLVKPFNGKGPKQSEMPPPLLALKLRVYRPVLTADESRYHNDERELNQRDRAHYAAYKAIGVWLCVPWLLSTLRIAHPDRFSGLRMSPDEMYFGLLLIAVTLFLTLPQAILLWTEPDMQPDLEPTA